MKHPDRARRALVLGVVVLASPLAPAYGQARAGAPEVAYSASAGRAQRDALLIAEGEGEGESGDASEAGVDTASNRESNGASVTAAIFSAQAKGPAAKSYPSVSGEARFEIENNFHYNRQNADEGRKRNQVFATFEPEISVDLTENLSIGTELQLEPVREFKDDNQEFQDEGIFLEQAFVEWKGQNFAFKLGKFQPTFGQAFEASRDLFGDEYAFEYTEFSEATEISERLGGSVSYEFGGDRIGSNTLSLDLFDSDTSPFSRSAIRTRGRLRRREGGPSNSGRLKSFGVNLIGEEVPLLGGVTYHLGFVYQDSGPVETVQAGDAAGDSPVTAGLGAPGLRGARSLLSDPVLNASDEEEEEDSIDPRRTGRPQRAYVGGLGYSFAANPDVDVNLFSEFLYLGNADGESNHIRTLLTVASSAVVRKNLYLGFSYARRTDRLALDSDANDYLLQTSATYYYPIGPGRLGFELDLRNSREDGSRAGTAGGRLIYLTEF